MTREEILNKIEECENFDISEIKQLGDQPDREIVEALFSYFRMGDAMELADFALQKELIAPYLFLLPEETDAEFWEEVCPHFKPEVWADVDITHYVLSSLLFSDLKDPLLERFKKFRQNMDTKGVYEKAMSIITGEKASLQPDYFKIGKNIEVLRFLSY